MGYWDYTPSSHHPKKPLTKAQLKKMQEVYASADAITRSVQASENEEQEEVTKELEKIIGNIL